MKQPSPAGPGKMHRLKVLGLRLRRTTQSA
jgi:hypothetical protein